MDELRSTECEYVIIGGGIAGWIIASRLSEEPNARVLILESSRYPSDPYIFASVLDTCWSSDYIQASFDVSSQEPGDDKIDLY